MLKDLNYCTTKPDSIYAMIAQLNGHNIDGPESDYFERYTTGVYRHDGYAFNGDGFIKSNCMENIVNEYPGYSKFSSYGVCDNYEQILDLYAEFFDDPNHNYCVILSTVRKDDQPIDGGWRWHKWGPYIGTKNPQYEYLYDEDDDIQVVYCYSIYEID